MCLQNPLRFSDLCGAKLARLMIKNNLKNFKNFFKKSFFSNQFRINSFFFISTKWIFLKKNINKSLDF